MILLKLIGLDRMSPKKAGEMLLNHEALRILVPVEPPSTTRVHEFSSERSITVVI